MGWGRDGWSRGGSTSSGGGVRKGAVGNRLRHGEVKGTGTVPEYV